LATLLALLPEETPVVQRAAAHHLHLMADTQVAAQAAPHTHLPAVLEATQAGLLVATRVEQQVGLLVVVRVAQRVADLPAVAQAVHHQVPVVMVAILTKTVAAMEAVA
jgi:hypothetical protein